MIGEVLQLLHTGQGVQEKRDPDTEDGSHRRVYCLGALVATAIGCYGPCGCLALLDGEPYRRGNAATSRTPSSSR